jgi:hypothetical protein
VQQFAGDPRPPESALLGNDLGFQATDPRTPDVPSPSFGSIRRGAGTADRGEERR